MAFVIGFAVLSGALLRPKSKAVSNGSPPIDEPSPVATRGSVLPYLIGRRRVSPIFAWVGNRVSLSAGRNQRTGKGSHPKTHGFSSDLIFNEDGIHMLCVGPAKKLYRIWENGTVFWEGPIDSDSHPSGSEITVTDGSKFTIYWGEVDQPIDTTVSTAAPLGMGIASRLPLCCYMVWKGKRLGPVPRWGQLECELETEIQYTGALAGEDAVINVSVATEGHPELDVAGINPAAALNQLLLGPFPYGLSQGNDVGAIDTECLRELSIILSGEKLPISSFASNGQTVLETVSAIMQDIGAIFAWDPNVGKFRFNIIRAGTPHEIDEALVCDPLPEIVTFASSKPSDKLLFAFADKDHNFKTSTVGLDDDGQAIHQDFQKATTAEMKNVIHFTVAQMVSERRSQELLARATKYQFTLDRGARRLFPGLTITVPSHTDDVLRITDTTVSPLSGKVTVSCLSDFYGVSLPAGYPKAVPGTPPAGGNQTYSVDPDVAFTLLEIPAHVLNGGLPTIVVPRVRGSTAMSASEILLSADDVTYEDEGQEADVQSGGALTSGLSATDPYEIAQGPTFNTDGPDIGTVLDLSSNEAAWRSGRQVALIGDELFFLQKVTALGGASYRLDGLLRARYDTERAAHVAADRVYIFQFDKIHDVQDPMLIPGALIYAKSDPAGLGGAVDLASVTAVSKTLVGKGIVPMAVGCLRTIDQRSSFRTGEDIDFLWNYRSPDVPHTGAGMQGAGHAVGTSPVDGYFIISFFKLDMTPIAAYVADTPDFTYSAATRISDFGSNLSLIAQVQNVNGGWKSPVRSLTVEFVS